MNTSKRLPQSMVIHEKNFAASTSALIETKLTPTTNTSQTTENHKKSSQANPLVYLQQQADGFYGESKLVQDHFDLISKITTKNKHINADITQNNSEDDWVCPVAVALRRAGYNVPLRPSKSWLERDRKQQALLHEQ